MLYVLCNPEPKDLLIKICLVEQPAPQTSAPRL